MLPSFQYYVNLFFEAAARLPSPEYRPAERKLPPGGPHNHSSTRHAFITGAVFAVVVRWVPESEEQTPD